MTLQTPELFTDIGERTPTLFCTAHQGDVGGVGGRPLGPPLQEEDVTYVCLRGVSSLFSDEDGCTPNR